MTRVKRIAGSALARLLAGYLLVAVVFASAWLWSLSVPLTEAAVRQQERNLTAVAQSAALVVTQSQREPSRIAEQMVTRTDLRLTIVAADGTVLADSDFNPEQMENHGSRPEVSAALSGATGVDRRSSRTEGNEQLYVAVPGTYDGQRIAVRVSQPLDEIQKIADRSRRTGLLLLAGALVLATAAALPVLRYAARPIQQLSETAERMAEGNLSVRIPDVPTDLEGLAGALDTLRSQMRARIGALEAERRTLRSALDGLADGVFVVEGDTILVANRAAEKMFRPPVTGWSGASIDSSELPASLVSAIRQRIATGDVVAGDLDPDPTGRTLRLHVAPLEPGVPGGRIVVVFGDVTERARLDKVRRDFVANASHELKTPVSGVRLLAESAETAAGDGDYVQAMVFAKQISAEAERLQRLVGDLLDLSRLEGAPSADAITDVRAAVDNAIVSHRSAAARKKLALQVDLTSIVGTDIYAMIDATDLAIALDNLVDNAIAYTDAGGVTVDVAADEDSVMITVSDTGAGIPPDQVTRIFERFYRVDGGRSRDSGGTGLGLALVRHVMERSNGLVSVESTLGQGSVFTIRLSRAR